MISLIGSYPWLLHVTGVFLTVFILREILTFKNIVPMKYILTPLVTMSVIAAVVLSMHYHGMSIYSVLILAGLLFALTADTLLMIVEASFLKYGLVFFLTGHFIYIAAFSTGYEFAGWHIFMLTVLAAICFVSIKHLKGKAGGLFVPASVYIIATAFMIFFAVARGAAFQETALFASAGVILFAVSDIILAVNAFIKPIPKSTVFTWLLYGPAQFFIALSCF